jgi:hypothetical protein
LFLLATDGLWGLMKRAVEIHCFENFEIGSWNEIISHIQYVDGTLYIGKTTVENLWTLNAIIRGFEMVSHHKVNFSKSCLMSVTTRTLFSTHYSRQLRCCTSQSFLSLLNRVFAFHINWITYSRIQTYV